MSLTVSRMGSFLAIFGREEVYMTSNDELHMTGRVEMSEMEEKHRNTRDARVTVA